MGIPDMERYSLQVAFEKEMFEVRLLLLLVVCWRLHGRATIRRCGVLIGRVALASIAW